MATTNYDVKIVGGEGLERIATKFPEIFQDKIKAPLAKIGMTAEGAAKAKAPVFTGHLRSSISHEVTVNSKQALVKIAPSIGGSVYPVVMELGRQAGSKPPPPSALVRWVHLVIAPPADQELSVAFVISRSIGRKGIKGKFYMKAGYEAIKDKAVNWIADALEEVLKSAAGA